MKTAIVYYSMSGNTRQTAEKTAALLGADLVPLVPETAYPDSGFKKFLWGGKSAVMGEAPALQPYRFDADAYERIVFGFPVWAGTFTPPIRTFINENKAALHGKRIAAFACLSGAGADKAFDKLKSYLGLDAFDATLALIDPKDKPNAENEAKLQAFCEQIK